MMVRIAVSYWGICADFEQHRFETLDTPDGHRYGRPLLIRELLSAGHQVFALQQRRERSQFPGVQYALDMPDVDIVFLEWRWSTYKNDPKHHAHDSSKHEPDLDRQREIIEFYRGSTPIVAWDTDLKITREDEELYPEIIIADPSLEPVTVTRPRISLPFWSDWRQLLPTAQPYPVYGLVGNNYERPGEFKKYYFDPSIPLRTEGYQTSMYGNWLQKSPEREDPSSLIRRHPAVAFNHRMNFYDSMSIMNRFIATTHVSKPAYYASGFISPRYMEALAMGCPALVPIEQIVNHVLGQRWIVRPHDVHHRVKELAEMSLSERDATIASQREIIRSLDIFDVGAAARKILGFAK